MSGGAYWRWYLGRTDIERVLISAGDMLQKRNEKYRMIGWQQLTDDDASVEVFSLDHSEPGGAHVAMITECDHVDEARERFVQFLELAVTFFAAPPKQFGIVGPDERFAQDVDEEPL